jgi:hypothetical protein
MPNLPASTDSKLLAAIPQMKPWSEASGANRWVLRETGKQYLVYAEGSTSAELDLSQEQPGFSGVYINPRSGTTKGFMLHGAGGAKVSLAGENGGPVLVWLTKDK